MSCVMVSGSAEFIFVLPDYLIQFFNDQARVRQPPVMQFLRFVQYFIVEAAFQAAAAVSESVLCPDQKIIAVYFQARTEVSVRPQLLSLRVSSVPIRRS